MNERIKELAEQAGLVIEVGEDEDASEVFDEAVEYISNSYDIDLKKFAELIVRECASVCDDERDSNDSEFGKLVAEICALKIMERFGVEE